MRVVAARVPGGPPGRLLYRPQPVRPLHPRVQHRAADDPGFYNQNMQLFQTPDQVVVLNGDGPRRAHRSPRGRPRPDIRVVDRRVERPLGRRHAGGRDHALQRQGLPEPSRATKDSDRYKVVNCTWAQPVFPPFRELGTWQGNFRHRPKRRPLVVPPVPIALKAALYEAFRKAGVSQRRLARDLDVAESEVRRMLNPDHATKSATIDRALRRLGKRVSVTVGEAA